MHYLLCLSLLVTLILLGVSASATPTILYPTDRPTFNYIDDVEISYETTFTGGAYLVLNCYELVTSHEFFEWIDADNPLNESGSYLWHAIGVNIEAQSPLQFPANCWFDLGPNIADDPSPNHVYQGNFSMVSSSASAKTWALSASSPSGAVPTTEAGHTATTSVVTSTSPSSPSSSQPLNQASSRLSTGAKAGIGVGAAAGAISVLGAIIYFIRLRRREARMRRELAAIQRERRIEGDISKAELDTQVPNKQGRYQVVEHYTETEGRPIHELSGRPVHGS